MRDIKDIEYFIRVWGKKTFLESMDDCWKLNHQPILKDKTIRVIEKLNLSDKKMDGYSVQGLPNINESEKMPVVFSWVFDEIYDDFLSPTYYFAKIIEKAGDFNGIEGVVARGWRAFPSFVRERDLMYKIKKSTYGQHHEILCELSPEQDKIEHTDIKISTDGRIYRLWSYLTSTDRGLRNTCDRVKGRRGELYPGLHILFPIDKNSSTQSQNYFGWVLYNKSYVENNANQIFSSNYQYDKYDNIKNMDDNDVKTYLKGVHVFKVD